MPRVKRGTTSNKRRRNVLSLTKGYRFGHKNKERSAREAIKHAGVYAFRDRRNKKRTFRQLWTTKINAALRKNDWTYSKFIDSLTKKKITINRKVLSEIAEHHPKAFENIIEQIK